MILGSFNDVVGKYNDTLKPGTALDDAGPDYLLAFSGLLRLVALTSPNYLRSKYPPLVLFLASSNKHLFFTVFPGM